jgi:hypothetical protein
MIVAGCTSDNQIKQKILPEEGKAPFLLRERNES